MLLPLGLTADSLRPGDRVTVRANPNRRGEGIVLGREVVKADGTVLPLFIASRSVRAPSDARATSLAGTWFAPREGFFAFNGGRQGFELTPAAQEALANFDSRDATHAECIPVTAPTLMVYPVTRTVTVSDDTVVLDIDWMTSRRTVYMDGRGHPDAGERTLHGHSIGHWEGDALVVDTTNFADHREGTALGIPSGARKHLVERFTLSDDGRHIEYSGVLEDPDYLEEPIEFASQWDYRPDLELSRLECDLDVARRYLNEQ